MLLYWRITIYKKSNKEEYEKFVPEELIYNNIYDYYHPKFNSENTFNIYSYPGELYAYGLTQLVPWSNIIELYKTKMQMENRIAELRNPREEVYELNLEIMTPSYEFSDYTTLIEENNKYYVMKHNFNSKVLAGFGMQQNFKILTYGDHIGLLSHEEEIQISTYGEFMRHFVTYTDGCVIININSFDIDKNRCIKKIVPDTYDIILFRCLPPANQKTVIIDQ